MSEFLKENASTMIAPGGAVGGRFISIVVGWLLRKREYDLRLWEKLLERRIKAHEQLINVAMEMRVMVTSGRVDEAGEPIRAPNVLLSREVFEEWFTRA